MAFKQFYTSFHHGKLAVVTRHRQVKQAGGCCLLTTHMLEEAEHLASYLAST